MNVTVETLPHSQSLVTVEVEPERVAQAKEQAFRRISREVTIPGFRKGRAPRHLVERYVKPETVQNDAEAALLEEIWTELATTGQFKDAPLVDTPQVKVTQHDPFAFEIRLTLQPSVQLGDYKSIRIAPELVTVSADDVSESVERLRQDQAQWQPVQHRPVRAGDMITIQAHGTLGKQPITVPDGYSRMLEHIAVHGYFMGLDQQRDIPEEEAVAHWYGTVYLPIVEVIRERGILEEFPGRTEGDLYLWVLDHQQFLHDHGKELSPPEEAAQEYVKRLEQAPRLSEL